MMGDDPGSVPTSRLPLPLHQNIIQMSISSNCHPPPPQHLHLTPLCQSHHLPSPHHRSCKSKSPPIRLSRCAVVNLNWVQDGLTLGDYYNTMIRLGASPPSAQIVDTRGAEPESSEEIVRETMRRCGEKK